MADSPWLCKVDRGLFAKELDAVRSFEPAARPEQPPPGRVGRFSGAMLAYLEAAPAASPFVGPDQAALEQMLASMGDPSAS